MPTISCENSAGQGMGWIRTQKTAASPLLRRSHSCLLSMYTVIITEDKFPLSVFQFSSLLFDSFPPFSWGLIKQSWQ